MEKMQTQFGLVPRPEWPAAIDKAVGEMYGDDGSGVDDLLDRIVREPAVLKELAAYLTVPETHFMRHHEHFAFVADYASKQLWSLPSGEKLRIWSAGCSSGEEPYTIAITLGGQLAPYPEERIDVVACDVSIKAIEKARQGAYSAWSFRRTPAWLLERYFDVDEGERFQLRPEIRRRVRFEHSTIENMASRLASGSVDIVLCRNVGIYLSPDALIRVFSEFKRVLKPSGYLIVAPGDPRPPDYLFQRTDHESTSIYRLATNSERERKQAKLAKRESSRSDRRVRTAEPKSVRKAPKCSKDSPRDSREPAVDLSRPRGLQALELAGRGNIESALNVADQMVERDACDAEAYLLRGQVHIAGTREEDLSLAIEDLRRAVFLRPQHAVARYWYALALSTADRPKKALAQLDAINELLARMPDDASLADGETSVDELREAVRFMREGLS